MERQLELDWVQGAEFGKIPEVVRLWDGTFYRAPVPLAGREL